MFSTLCKTGGSLSPIHIFGRSSTRFVNEITSKPAGIKISSKSTNALDSYRHSYTKCYSKESDKVKTYQAVQFDPVSKYLTLVNRPLVKQVKDNEVWVQVAYAGVCGTDLHIMEGRFPVKKTPVILGHELCGKVKRVGAAVRHVKPGDNVVVNPFNACQRCRYCAIGKPHFCDIEGVHNAIGYFKDGGWAEYCLVPQNLVFKLPKTIELEQAVLCEPMSCITHALNLVKPLPKHSKILISGAGIAGTLLATIFRYEGYHNVTITEVNKHRLEQAKMNFCVFGYQVVNPCVLKCKCSAPTFDLAIDCTGNIEAIEDAISWLGHGGRLLLYGVVATGGCLKLSPFQIFRKELKILGALINQHAFPDGMDRVNFLGTKYLKFDNLGIRTFRLCEYTDAMRALRDGDILKAVFKFDTKRSDKPKKCKSSVCQ